MSQLRRIGSVLFFVLTILLCCHAQSGNPIVYIYDELGRLVAVTDPNSDTVRYTYDAVGNLLSISRYSSAQPSIIRFDPGSGPVGSSVTISGTGFSPTTTQNTVQFNGTTAAVNSATLTQLTVAVPSGATTGPITVTTPAGTVTSANSFTVVAGSGPPAITSFTPTIGVTGTSVNIVGANFDPQLSNDSVEFNLTRAIPSSGTATSLAATVPPVATSGHIAVRTLAGRGVSSGYFFIPPPPYSVNSVQYTGQIALGGQTNVAIPTASSIGLLVFDGTQGKGVSITTSGGTFGSCNLTISILTPTGATLGSNNCMGSSGLLGSLTLPATGTYTILLAPSGSATGSVTLNLYDATDVTGTITPGGAPITSTITVPGQKVRLSFAGTYQQIVSSEAAGLVGGSFSVSILQPNGTSLASGGGSNQVSLIGNVLPVPGTYQLLVTPNNTVTGSVTVSLISQTTNGIINFNTPVTSSITKSSLIGRSFSGTAGQIVSLEAAGLGGGGFAMYVLNPDGNTLATNCCVTNQTAFLGKTLATTGTYQIVIVPNNSVTGSVTVSLISADNNGSVNFNSPVTTSTSTSSLVGLDFSGTAGQIVSLEATGLGGGGFAMYVLNPNGSTLASNCCASNQASFVGLTLGTIGTYEIVIVPNNGVTGSVTVSLISANNNGSVNFNTPVTTSTSTSSLIGFDFSGAAGQIVSLEATGLGGGGFAMYALNPNGSTLASNCCARNQASFVGLTLATTGTYEIVIVPNNGVTGSVTVSLISANNNSSINFNSPVTTNISPSSLIGFDFSGTAGQIVSLEAAGLGGGMFAMYVLNPNGSTLASNCCATNQASFVGLTLGTTGTYEIVIVPNNGLAGSVTVSLISANNNGSVNFNTPVTTSTSTSSLIGFDFSGTAGQIVSLEATGLGGGGFAMYVLNPNGSTLASNCCASNQASLVGLTLATTGTYEIVIVPNNGVTGAVTASLISADNNSTINFGSPITSTITVSSLIGLSFSGTAGQTASVQVTPSFSGGGFSVYVLNPNGSTLASTFSIGPITFSSKNLGTTGTYQVVIVPNNNVTGSATTSLTSP